MHSLLRYVPLACAIAFAGPAPAQNGYPSKAVRIIVGAAPGGPTDLVARLLGEKLSQDMGVPFIVENRGGGVGVIASETVARAEPDGYTLLMGSVSTHGINPALYRKLNYDALKDFAPISQVVSYPLVLLVNPTTVPVSNMGEFLAYVRKHPGKVNRGSAGNGTSMHIAGELFKSLGSSHAARGRFARILQPLHPERDRQAGGGGEGVGRDGGLKTFAPLPGTRPPAPPREFSSRPSPTYSIERGVRPAHDLSTGKPSCRSTERACFHHSLSWT
ncbi:tripartite tricarboxylate transporter substrate-binding protein [Pigmentiphaga sp. GD03639]|uniref:Bug family tripartite tricarboxylate transporter substrate binding protein n=1 Tax=Pigmentiphaga sp. GD03639 TaxID=2975354 RepID=UPI002448F93B|nr:tripartite tricarboxylate transporter substrate-binding protein [Pigmentiphaga sp. GD03639]MDH2236341.1 tripartite tricarboxylate transporter substrate-binding protein [Pigmentiphaga sp. GD03639]